MLRAFLFPGAVSLLKFCNKSAICYHTLSENSARIMDLSAGIFFSDQRLLAGAAANNQPGHQIMLDGLLCYRNAAVMLLCNIKAYLSLVIMNTLFFALTILCPALVYSLLGGTSGMEPALVSGMLVITVFMLANFLMLTAATNAVSIDAENRTFAISELFRTGITRLQMCMLGAGVNFVLFTFYIFIIFMLLVFAGQQAAMAAGSLILLAEAVISVFLFVYVTETVRAGDFKKAYSLAAESWRRYPRLMYGFIPVCIILCLTMAYLVYTFADGMADIARVVNEAAVLDMQQAVLHCMLSVIFLVLLNTLNLTAKGMLIRRMDELKKEDQKYIA